MENKLWGGRFDGQTDPFIEGFTTSLPFDQRLWRADIRASLVHVQMLVKVGVISQQEGVLIEEGLQSVASNFCPSSLKANAEDIHSEIERLLTEKIGPVAGKLHTGRSRNDQVVTSTRLYLRERLDFLVKQLVALQQAYLERAENHIEDLLPGLTHMQHGQPVSLAHHLLTYFWMFERDRRRLEECRKRVNQLPLGAAALAGTGYPLDRHWVAEQLGFESVIPNSMDAVSDRDFVFEFISVATLAMLHLSRACEEWVLWSTPEYGFIEWDDCVATGSSIMPQKKNPDVAEIIRGKMGRVGGALTAIQLILKGLPLTYHRDLQEDKVHLFDSLDTYETSLKAFHIAFNHLHFKTDKMLNSVSGDYSNATDIADYLVKRGIPFRQAHQVVGELVKYCLTQEIALESLSGQQLSKFHPKLGPDLIDKLQPRAVLEARSSYGGTAPSAVFEQMALAKQVLMA